MKLEDLRCVDENIDIQAYIDFREDVKSKMEHPEWLGNFTYEELDAMLKDNSNKLGLTDSLHKLILYRLDLIIMPIDQLKSLLSKVDKELFVRLVKTNIKNLILLF